MSEDSDRYNQSNPDLTMDYIGKYLLSHKDILAKLVKVIFPEEFLGLSDNEIIVNHLSTNTLNENRVDLKTEETVTEKGKQTRYDLSFEVKTRDGKTVLVNLELQRQRSDDISIRAILYPSKMVAEQIHKNYDDFNKAVSTWINLDPLKEDRNTIIVSEFTDYLLKIEGDNYTKTLIDKPSQFDLIKIVQINVGGPEDENFEGIFKFLYYLFHNNQEEIQQFFDEDSNFNIEEILNPMMRYKTLDEQARDVYFDEGLKKGEKKGLEKGIIQGKEEGRIEGIKENQINTFNKLLKRGWTIEAAREFVYETDV